jgi:hypothetical protein
MEIEENNFKDIIIPKIKKATASLANNKHSRILLSDFGSIQRKKLGKNFLFFNNTYKNVNHIFFNLKYI